MRFNNFPQHLSHLISSSSDSISSPISFQVNSATYHSSEDLSQMVIPLRSAKTLASDVRCEVVTYIHFASISKSLIAHKNSRRFGSETLNLFHFLHCIRYFRQSRLASISIHQSLVPSPIFVLNPFFCNTNVINSSNSRQCNFCISSMRLIAIHFLFRRFSKKELKK